MAMFDKLKGLIGKSSSKKSLSKKSDAGSGNGAENAVSSAESDHIRGKVTRKLDVSKRFALDRQAASGTMSKFRAAREIETGKIFGLKLIDVEKRKHFESRFKGLNKPTEGAIGMKLSHERIVETYEYGVTITNQPYIVMEYIPGAGLSSLIVEESPLLDGKRLTLIRQMAESIQALHEAGFIHRDICPRNFICSEDASWLKLIDFGLTVPDEREYRMPGNRTGTPLYMAPEIVRRRKTDKRVDIFAFGISCYRLLSGAHPWSSGGDASGKVALAHDTFEPKQILDVRPNTDPVLAEAVMRCIDPKPDNRFDSLEKFLKGIRKVEHEDAK